MRNIGLNTVLGMGLFEEEILSTFILLLPDPQIIPQHFLDSIFDIPQIQHKISYTVDGINSNTTNELRDRIHEVIDQHCVARVVKFFIYDPKGTTDASSFMIRTNPANTPEYLSNFFGARLSTFGKVEIENGLSEPFLPNVFLNDQSVEVLEIGINVKNLLSIEEKLGVDDLQSISNMIQYLFSFD